MVSQAQIEANKRNAQKSTGPRTPSGKEKAAQNSLKHGLTARQALIAGENPDDFHAHRAALLDDLAPVGPMESMLADRIITLSWRLTRTARLQSGTLNALKQKSDAPTPLQKLLNRPPSGLEPQDSSLDTDLSLGRLAITDFSTTRVLERLLMYERRLESSLYRTFLQLQHLQFLRQKTERQQSALMDLDNDDCC